MTAAIPTPSNAGSPDTTTSESVPSPYTGLDDPGLASCIAQEGVCDESAVQELTGVPEALPAPAGAPVIARGRAESIARGNLTSAAVEYSRLFTSGKAADDALNIGRASSYDASRAVWVVTVHAAVQTEGLNPRDKDGLSLVIDAFTGKVTDECIGCLWLTSSR